MFSLLIFSDSVFGSSRSYIVGITSCTIDILYANHFLFFETAVELSGEVEENPIPKPSFSQSFFICQWNLSSIFAHN